MFVLQHTGTAEKDADSIGSIQPLYDKRMQHVRSMRVLKVAQKKRLSLGLRELNLYPSISIETRPSIRISASSAQGALGDYTLKRLRPRCRALLEVLLAEDSVLVLESILKRFELAEREKRELRVVNPRLLKFIFAFARPQKGSPLLYRSLRRLS